MISLLVLFLLPLLFGLLFLFPSLFVCLFQFFISLTSYLRAYVSFSFSVCLFVWIVSRSVNIFHPNIILYQHRANSIDQLLLVKMGQPGSHCPKIWILWPAHQGSNFKKRICAKVMCKITVFCTFSQTLFKEPNWLKPNSLCFMRAA